MSLPVYYFYFSASLESLLFSPLSATRYSFAAGFTLLSPGLFHMALGLKVNTTKTKVTKPSNLKYLGFGFWKDSEGWKARPHQDSVARFKRKLKKLTSRRWSISMDDRIDMLNAVIRGWINYYRMGSMKTVLHRIDEQLRTRMRVVIWKQ